ncbi:MAG: hypothetical protein R3B49_00465 [Phycisphaerales bacterium]
MGRRARGVPRLAVHRRSARKRALGVLFVCGDLDPFIAAARGAALLMPNARLVELPAVAHTEVAARLAFTEAVADFVKPD